MYPYPVKVCTRARKKPGPVIPARFWKTLLFYADLLAVAAHALERDAAVHQGKQGVVAAAADILTRMDMGAALADQDIAGEYELAVAALYAETCRLGIAAVLESFLGR